MSDSEPLRLTREELLEVENKYLRIQNLELQVEVLGQKIEQATAQKQTAEQLIKEAKLDFDEFRSKLSSKYGAAIERGNVQPDGTIGSNN